MAVQQVDDVAAGTTQQLVERRRRPRLPPLRLRVSIAEGAAQAVSHEAEIQRECGQRRSRTEQGATPVLVPAPAHKRIHHKWRREAHGGGPRQSDQEGCKHRQGNSSRPACNHCGDA